MIEIIKELAGVLKDLPDMAIWIMLGILFYKVFIIGGTISLAKYAINKLHDFMSKSSDNKHAPKEITTTYDIGGRFISSDGALGLFNQLLDEIHTGVNIDSHYIHRSDVEFLLDAVREKRLREKQQ